MKNNLWKKITAPHVVIAVLILLIAYEIVMFFGASFDPTQNTATSLSADAEKVVQACQDANYRPACYDKEIPKLMDKLSMEDAFAVTRLVQDLDTLYQYCHVLAHELSAREANKNPDGWKDVIMRCPSGTCSNGCIHGAFQERFRAESLTKEEAQAIKPELMDLCEQRGAWKPTGLEQASCYHALGHLTMYITSADINEALLLCNDVAKKPDGRDYVQLCYDGSFMQIFQPLEPEDFALIEGKEVPKEELRTFCDKFAAQPRASCWSEGWPLFRDEMQVPEGLTAHCNQEGEQYRDRCFESLTYVMTAQMNLDADRAYNYCSGYEPERTGRCFAAAASRMIEVDYDNIEKASNLCGRAAGFDPDQECFGSILKFSTYNYHAGSDEFFTVCNALPGEWKEKCLNRQRS